MALFRALETARGRRALFRDRLAARVIRPRLLVAARLAAIPVLRWIIERIVDWRSPGARTSGVARTRLIDDWVSSAVAEGATQVVLLGAGFDARAYRLPALRECAVFEVDTGPMVAAKQAAVGRTYGPGPPRPRYVGMDFNRHDVSTALNAAGFDPSQRTCFVLEGVSNYLDPDAASALLRTIAVAGAPRSRLVFTYIDWEVLRDPGSFAGAEKAVRMVQRSGEPWTFGLAPDDLAAYLDAAGLELIEDCSSEVYRQRYLGHASRALRGFGFYRAALAETFANRATIDPRP